MKKVYTIVLMQKSTKEFHNHPETYLHYSRQTFDSGLNMDLLQEYLLVPLDIFLNLPHNEISRLDAWLYFIASDNMKDIERVCDRYPEFCELYREVFQFRFQSKELVDMYWKELRETDREEARYMIDDMRQEIEEKRQELAEHKQELAEHKQELAERKQELAERKQELAERKQELAARDKTIEAQRTELKEKRLALESQEKELERLRARLAELERNSQK